MSANLLDDATVMRGTKDGDGYWVLSQNDGTDKQDSPRWRIDGQPTLTENQTVHVACSVMPDEDWGSNAARMSVQYTDGAGHSHWVGTNMGAARAGAWTRLEAELVVPSGMRMTQCLLTNAYTRSSGAKVANPVFSYGSPVCLASSAHTPYATQDHVAAEYSTKASQKILSDSITSEVNARAKTDGAVSELSSRMEQTVNGINVSLDKLTATEQQIHSWFDFGTDPSGNPKLSMGSSSSPIIGEYTNSGATYKDRSGATLLALDASTSTTGADHVVSKDMTVGGWKWMPTNGGTHFTLMWIGG